MGGIEIHAGTNLSLYQEERSPREAEEKPFSIQGKKDYQKNILSLRSGRIDTEKKEVGIKRKYEIKN